MTTIEPRAGCVLRHKSAYRWENARHVRGHPDCFECSAGTNTVDFFKQTHADKYEVVLPSVDEHKEGDPLMAWAWEHLKAAAIQRVPDFPADKNTLWLWRHGDTDDSIDVATVWVENVWPNDLKVAFNANAIEHGHPLRNAANVVDVLNEWVNSIYRRQDALRKR